MPNTPFDRALDLWKDHEKLGWAHVSLAAKCKDPCIDIFLWTRLTGMLGVLNLYLDPSPSHMDRSIFDCCADPGKWGEVCTQFAPVDP